jgi:hypothetical protein
MAVVWTLRAPILTHIRTREERPQTANSVPYARLFGFCIVQDNVHIRSVP